MPKILLGLGSNINREENIRSGVDLVSRFLKKMKVSPVYESPAFGFVGDPFFNLAISGMTDTPLDELVVLLREIEFSHGRAADAEKFSSRQLDIDVLLYGDKTGLVDGIQLPRAELVEQAYVLKPVCDIEADWHHPVSQKTFRLLWQEFGGDKRNIWQSDFQCIHAESA